MDHADDANVDISFREIDSIDNVPKPTVVPLPDQPSGQGEPGGTVPADPPPDYDG